MIPKGHDQCFGSRLRRIFDNGLREQVRVRGNDCRSLVTFVCDVGGIEINAFDEVDLLGRTIILLIEREFFSSKQGVLKLIIRDLDNLEKVKPPTFKSFDEN